MLLFACTAGVLLLQHTAQAQPPGYKVCPGDKNRLGVSIGNLDGRCHQIIANQTGSNSTTSLSGSDEDSTYNTTVHRGDVLNFSFTARSSSGDTADIAVPLVNWASINGSPSFRQTISNVSGGSISSLQYCLGARDTDTAGFGSYHCGNNNEGAGRTISSLQNLSATQPLPADDTVSFRITVPLDALDAGVGCVRFHTARFTRQHSPVTPANVTKAIQDQLDSGESPDYEIEPVYAVSYNYCFTVSVPCTPCSGCAGDSTNPACTNPVLGARCDDISTTHTASLGQNVVIGVRYSNLSDTTDWYVGANSQVTSDYTITTPPNAYHAGTLYYPSAANSDPEKQHSGVLKETGEATPLNRIENSNAPPRDRLASKGLLQTPAGLSSHGGGDTNAYWTDRSYTVTNSTTVGAVAYHFYIRNDESGDKFGNSDSLCSVVINWTGGSIDQFDCTTTKVTGPGTAGYHLHITETDTGNAWNVPSTGSWSGNYNSDNTFRDFNFMRPHHTYSAVMQVDGAGTTTPSADLNDGRLCMSAICQTNITTGPVVVEPDQTISAKYGVKLVNSTNQAFTEYNVQSTGHDGLDGGGTDNDQFAAGVDTPPSGGTNLDGPFTVTAHYKGYMTADLYYNSTKISDTFFLACQSDSYTPATRATLQVKNGDIATGGGFANASNQCTGTSADGYISPKSKSNDYAGGVRTFSDGFTGAGSDFGTYALGYINGDSGQKSGFYSSGNNQGAGSTALNFANNFSGDLGGLMAGDKTYPTPNTSAYCAHDYFDTTRNSPTLPDPGDTFTLNSLTPNQQYYHHGLVIINGSNIAAGNSLTLYVDGNVVINGDISYSNYAFNMNNRTNNAPYLAIVAKGDIYVLPHVSAVAGLYVAQPRNDGSGGLFVTCSNGGTVPDAAQITEKCAGSGANSNLIVNGSVVAQHVYATRMVGTLSSSGPSAETFNFLPSMLLGQPNFKSLNGGVILSSPVEGSSSSLPPTF